MWNPFKSKREEPKTLVLDSNIKLYKDVSSPLREHMWVVADNRVGILHKLNGNEAEVHYVDADTGDTVVIVNITIDSIRQARYAEIPLSRRGISSQAARSMGYGD